MAVLAVGLSGCDDIAQLNPFQPRPQPQAEAAEADASVRLVERDVEAPDVFQVTDMGLWDGRPSLGGVWVAHPAVGEPERVIIRNTANAKFVIGALFRREREIPGPELQVSSDAAAALGMLAGAPAELNVTALRRETAPPPPEETAGADTAAAPEAPEQIEAAEAEARAVAEAVPVDGAAEAPPERPASPLEKPYIQVGIFSVERNAENTATAMRRNGMVPTVKKQSASGKTFWRVIVGPAGSKSERRTLQTKIRGIGFADAYPVTN